MHFLTVLIFSKEVASSIFNRLNTNNICKLVSLVHFLSYNPSLTPHHSPEALPPRYFVCACAGVLERNSKNIQAKESNCLVSGEYFQHPLDENLFSQFLSFCLFRKDKIKYFHHLFSALNKSEILVESLRRDPICISCFWSFEVHPHAKLISFEHFALFDVTVLFQTDRSQMAWVTSNASISHEKLHSSWM